MLARKSYPQEYVAAVRGTYRDQLASYAALGLSDAQRAGFEPGYVHQLLLALEQSFAHRTRGLEGKDGNPLNEVRMLAASVPAGVLVEDPTVRWRPEASVTGLAVGDRIDVDAATFGTLAEAFLDEIEKRFPEA